MLPRSFALGLLVLAVAACNQSSAPASTASKPTPTPEAAALAPKLVSPEVVARESVIETTGKVQFNEEALGRVHAPLTGRVLEVFAAPGDTVEAGSRLFVLDSADLGAAKADYAKAVADVERSQDALRLARELLEVKAVAQKEVRETENDTRKALAERERAAARLQTLGVGSDRLPGVAARTDVGTTLVVRAPRGGVVVERNVVAGQVVAYGQADAPVNLFVIADLSTMWVVADVYEPDVPNVHLGQPVSVALPCCPSERYRGKVVNIANAVDKDSRTLKIRAVVPNRGRTLKAEMFVKVAIDTSSYRVLTLPQTAVQRREGRTFVLVENGKGGYQRRPIKTRAEFDGFVEVLDGVTPADRVVSTGGILIGRDAQ